MWCLCFVFSSCVCPYFYLLRRLEGRQSTAHLSNQLNKVLKCNDFCGVLDEGVSQAVWQHLNLVGQRWCTYVLNVRFKRHPTSQTKTSGSDSKSWMFQKSSYSVGCDSSVFVPSLIANFDSVIYPICSSTTCITNFLSFVPRSTIWVAQSCRFAEDKCH